VSFKVTNSSLTPFLALRIYKGFLRGDLNAHPGAEARRIMDVNALNLSEDAADCTRQQNVLNALDG
jgi:hypothetical protein